MSNVVPLGITHNPGCHCLRCLGAAYKSADTEARETARRYQLVRTGDAGTAEIGRARLYWAEARQVLVLAELALRTAEDEAHVGERENQRADSLRWNPRGAIPS
jgi:hypothetical protein